MNIHEVEGFQGYDVVWTVNIGVVCDYSLLNKEKNMSTSAWWKYIIKLKKKMTKCNKCRSLKKNPDYFINIYELIVSIREIILHEYRHTKRKYLSTDLDIFKNIDIRLVFHVCLVPLLWKNYERCLVPLLWKCVIDILLSAAAIFECTCSSPLLRGI